VKCHSDIRALGNSLKRLEGRVGKLETKLSDEIEKLAKKMDIWHSKIEAKQD